MQELHTLLSYPVIEPLNWAVYLRTSLIRSTRIQQQPVYIQPVVLSDKAGTVQMFQILVERLDRFSQALMAGPTSSAAWARKF
ncbi:hypothetical protein B9Z34_10585 [Limnohabitans sp. Hippo3]|nr:hypothetical protein B9Z34_10585 [Limnohabitans sp. Hippo3]